MSLFEDGDIEERYTWDWPESARDDVATVDGLPSEVDDGSYEELAQFIETKNKECVDDTRLGYSATEILREGIYRQLCDPFEIRLLYLRPAHDSENSDKGSALSAPLVCSLEHASVEFSYRDAGAKRIQSRHAVDLKTGKPRWYTALSYCWGPPDDTCSIQIVVGQVAHETGAIVPSVQEKPITPNLDAVLRRLRAEGDGKTVCLWIDQLCINQADDEEKGRQIGLMATIYQRALNTAVWLGEDARDSDQLATGVSSGSVRKDLHTDGAQEDDTKPTTGLDVLRFLYHQFRGLYGHDGSDAIFEDVKLPCPREIFWSKLRSTLDRPYFWRVWIIQEVVLSKTAVVRIGGEKMHWNVFSTFCLVASESGYLPWLEASVDATERWDIAGVCDIISKINSLSLQLSAMANGITILTVLNDTRYALATVKKDKIFGILGLSSSRLNIDYGVNDGVISHAATQQLLREELDTMAANMHKYKSWESGRFLISPVLCAVDHAASSTSPSWVPDWTRPRETVTIGGTTVQSANYHAGGKDRRDQKFEIHDEGKTLHINGELVDSVYDLTQTCTDVGDLLPRGDRPNAVIEAFLNFVHEHEGQIKGVQGRKELHDLLWSTLVAGKDAAPGAVGTDRGYRAVFENSLTNSPHRDYPKFREPSEIKSQNKKAKKRKEKGPHRAPLHERWRPDVRVAFSDAVRNRRLCFTSEGRLALVPRHARKEDRIAVFARFPVPFVLRAKEKGCFDLVGECYVDGVMKGETAGMGYVTTTIKLV